MFFFLKVDSGVILTIASWALVQPENKHIETYGGHKFTYTCKDVYHGSLQFHWLLQLSFFCDAMRGTQTTLSHKTLIENIQQLEQSNFGIIESCVNQIFFVAWTGDVVNFIPHWGSHNTNTNMAVTIHLAILTATVMWKESS